MYLADGAIRLRVSEVRDGEVEVEVEVGGAVASRQGLNLPNVTMSLPAVSEADLRMIDAGVEMGVDLMALSFIRRAEDLQPVRERLEAHGSDIPLIAKIEKPQAAANAEEIVEAADGIMVARGDLGIELPIEQVPLVQKRLLHVAGQRAKPCITATQMLESMVSSTRPTRAEVADVANAIFDGTDAVMLSQETAVGRDPPGAVEMMAAIARATEQELPYWRLLTERGLRGGDDSASIAFGAVGAVYQLGLVALVCPTLTGKTARLISSHRPQVPTLALSPRLEVVRRCAIYWGVQARLMKEPHDTPGLLEACERAGVEAGLCSSGDKIGITAGLPAGLAGAQAAAGRHRSNASSARSRCSRSCVAITLVRSSAPPRSTAGYSATFTYTPASNSAFHINAACQSSPIRTGTIGVTIGSPSAPGALVSITWKPRSASPRSR